eukprot:1115791-Prymnesium_polylepis.3
MIPAPSSRLTRCTGGAPSVTMSSGSLRLDGCSCVGAAALPEPTSHTSAAAERASSTMGPDSRDELDSSRRTGRPVAFSCVMESASSTEMAPASPPTWNTCRGGGGEGGLSLIHISEPTRRS